MYALSSQKKYWTFKTEQELAELRLAQNIRFIAKHGAGMTEEQKLAHFLSADEERQLLKQYESHMKEFCKKFEPPMPKYVVGTAFHYFKRFYLNNSAMDYHPKEILATCIYLACKVEEFNVSIAQFVANTKGDRVKAMDIILSNELLLMQELNYYLTIHNPMRPIEGFLIDIKTRCNMKNPDRLRPWIEDFIDKTFLTDVPLMYAPAQIALAAVLHAASKEQENLDSYVTESLFGSAKDKLPVLIEAVRRVRSLVNNTKLPTKELFRFLDKKLEKCRNQENNPDSQIYKQRMKKMYEDEDDLDAMGSSFHMNVSDASLEVSQLNTTNPANMTLD
ncbi:cyclin-H [Anopheles coustani]|uniref:cyclin-H n=1 Tax=Anopheles coustani TaxID=139045 RepID=UPI002658CD5E|nr:cyclin-H [Anopheles coustani]